MDDRLFVHVLDRTQNLRGVESCRYEVERSEPLDPLE